MGVITAGAGSASKGQIWGANPRFLHEKMKGTTYTKPSLPGIVKNNREDLVTENTPFVKNLT